MLIKNITESVGTVFTDLDLTDIGAIPLIKDKLTNRILVHIKNENPVDKQTLVNFAKNLGDPIIFKDDIFDKNWIDDTHPEIVNVESIIGDQPNNLKWHIDLCQRVNRPVTLLYGTNIPRNTAPTLYCDLHYALNYLKPMNNYADLIVESYSPYESTYTDNASWRLIRKHKLNGKKVIDITDIMFKKFKHINEEESKIIKDEIIDDITEYPTYTHHWQPYDIVLFENWGQIHKRPFIEGEENRSLARISIDITEHLDSYT